MQGIHIVATGRALPGKVVTNHDLSKMTDTSDEWIVARTGIHQRYYCENETCKTLIAEAAGKAIREAADQEGMSLQDIGVVVVATVTSDYAFPSAACLLQKELGLPKETMAFDISAACSGFLYGLQVCRALLAGSKKKYALLVGSEQLSRILDFADRSGCILFGDGAGAAIVRQDSSMFFHKAWSDGNADVLSCKGVGFGTAKVQMEGKEVFKFAVRAFKEGIDEILKEAGMCLQEIDYVVCHQANRRIIEYVMKKYPGQEHKFYINIGDYANTSAASIPIALDEMREKRILKTGMKIIAVGFGAGLTWSSALITI